MNQKLREAMERYLKAERDKATPSMEEKREWARKAAKGFSPPTMEEKRERAREAAKNPHPLAPHSIAKLRDALRKKN